MPQLLNMPSSWYRGLISVLKGLGQFRWIGGRLINKLGGLQSNEKFQRTPSRRWMIYLFRHFYVPSYVKVKQCIHIFSQILNFLFPEIEKFRIYWMEWFWSNQSKNGWISKNRKRWWWRQNVMVFFLKKKIQEKRCEKIPWPSSIITSTKNHFKVL